MREAGRNEMRAECDAANVRADKAAAERDKLAEENAALRAALAKLAKREAK